MEAFISNLDPSAWAQLIAAGGSYTVGSDDPDLIGQVIIPVSLLNQPIPGETYTWGTYANDLVNVLSYTQITADGGLHVGVISPGEVRFTTAYDQNIVAQGGYTTLVKQMAIDTRNKPATNLWNVQANTALTFIATADGGNVVGEENMMLDGAGNSTAASTKMLCPFGSYPDDVIPAFCNIVQTGNKYDLSVGSVDSTLRDRFVGTDATIPVMIQQDYTVSGYAFEDGTSPAIGSSMAYVKAHIQEARGVNSVTFWGGHQYYNAPTTPLKSEDLTYSQVSSVNGIINTHNYQFAYQSGKSLIG